MLDRIAFALGYSAAFVEEQSKLLILEVRTRYIIWRSKHHA
jgi:hypothetical protein